MWKTIDKLKAAKIYFNKKRLVFITILDGFLTFLYSFKRSSPINHDCKQYKKVLILESHLIGDVIMSLPACRAIRERLPGTELIFWGDRWGKELLEDQGIFDKFFTTRIPWAVYDYSFGNLRKAYSQAKELKELKPDLTIDFRGDIRNIFLLYLIKAGRRVSYDFTGGTYWLTDVVPPPENFHLIERDLNVAKFIGAESSENVPWLEVPQAKLQNAKKYFKSQGLDNIVFLHPGASQTKKLWLADRFAKVVEYLQKKGFFPVLLGGPQDKPIVNSIKSMCDVSPDILSVPLNEMAAYLSCGEIFIGLDSGIGHIAAAVGLDVITLFGPQPPSIASPKGGGKITEIIKGNFNCRPCHKKRCPFDNACMKAIQVEDVIRAIHELTPGPSREACGSTNK